MKPRLVDIAEAAGVGSATVWRVLNDQGTVSPATAARVVDAARRLGLRRQLPERYQPRLRFEIFLVASESLFYGRLDDAFLRARASLGAEVILHRSFVPETAPLELAARIRGVIGQRQGLIVLAAEHPEVAAALDEAADAGVPVVTLVTDHACRGRLACVEVDQYAAGRTAGHFLGIMMRGEGKAAILAGRRSFRVHRQRIAGCRDVLAERFPAIRLAEVVEGRDERRRTHDAVAGVVEAHPDLAGLYNTASANRDVAAALRETGRAGRVVFVGHETTEATIALLKSRVMSLTIDQNPELHALRALHILIRHARHGTVDPAEATVPFSVYSPENLPLRMSPWPRAEAIGP